MLDPGTLRRMERGGLQEEGVGGAKVCLGGEETSLDNLECTACSRLRLDVDLIP